MGVVGMNRGLRSRSWLRGILGVQPAPAIAPLLSNDSRFFAINAMMLRNASAVNMLDGCALSIPCHQPGQMPVGLMVWGPAMADDTVLGVGLTIEAALAAGESPARVR